MRAAIIPADSPGRHEPLNITERSRFEHGDMPWPRGTETVLVVEDEDTVRLMIRQSLQLAGYSVLEANRGTEALQLAAQYSGPIHLLITDVVLPGISGRELAEDLIRQRPALKVLYMSGHMEDAVVRRGVLPAEVAFLQKPITVAALTNKVRQVLDAA